MHTGSWRMVRLPGLMLLAGMTIVLASCADSAATRAGRYGPAADLAKLQPDKDLTLLKHSAFQQTQDHTCGPATLITLLRFYGQDGDEMKIADQIGCTKEKGTDPQAMVKFLESRGFQVTWGEKGTLAMLRENLAKGIPTIVEWIDWGGHWVTVIGYDTCGTQTEDDDMLIFADPADCHDGRVDGITNFNALRFKDMWFDAFLFDKPMHELYVTAVPKGRKPGQPG